MVTVNGWCAGGMGGVGKWGDECSVNGGDEGKAQTFAHLFLKPLAKESLTTEAC